MKIQSHNSDQTSLVRQLFVPNPIKVLLYMLTSFIILMGSNILNFWNYFYADPEGQKQVLDLFGNGSGSETQSGFFNSTLQGRLGQIIVWGLIGVGIYIVIWFIKNILTNLRNDVVADEYIHPHSYNRKSYWRSILVRKGFFVLISAVLIGFIFLCYKLLPLLSSIFFNAAISLTSKNVMIAIATSVAVAVILHVLVVLSQMAINSWRIISTDL